MHDLPPDPEPVLGWRAWRLERRDEGLRLISLTRDDAWPAYEPMRARCDVASHGDAPGLECSCGIYAAHEPEALAHASIGAHNAAVVGRVAMWGRVVEHELGVRAHSAYAARLRLVCASCLVDGRGAVDPIVVSERSSALVSTCATHARGVADVVDAGRVRSELLATYGVDLLPIEHVRDTLKTPPPTMATRVRRGLEALFAGALPTRGRLAAS